MSPALTARQVRASKHQKAAERELEQLNGGAAGKHLTHGHHSGDPTRGLREHLAEQQRLQEGEGLKSAHRRVKQHFDRHGDKYKAAGTALAALGATGAAVKASRDPATQARARGAVAQTKQVVETGAQLGTAALDTATQASQGQYLSAARTAAGGLRDAQAGVRHTRAIGDATAHAASHAAQYPRASTAAPPTQVEIQAAQAANDVAQRRAAKQACDVAANKKRRGPERMYAQRQCKQQYGSGHCECEECEQEGDGALGRIGNAALGASGVLGGVAGLSAATGVGIPAAIAEGTLAAGLGAAGGLLTGADSLYEAMSGDGALGRAGSAALGASGVLGGVAGLSAATGIGIPAAIAEGTLAAGLGAAGGLLTGADSLYEAMSGGSLTRPQVCRYTVPALRKAINMVRRDLRKLPPRKFVKAHAGLTEVRQMVADSDLAVDGIAEFRETINDMPMNTVKRLQREIKARVWLPASRLNRAQLEDHIWMLASDMRVSWADTFHQLSRRQSAAERHAEFTDTAVPKSAIAERSRVNADCRKSEGLKAGMARPPAPAPRTKRPLTAYQTFVKEHLAQMATDERFANMNQRERMRWVAGRWKEYKQGLEQQSIRQEQAAQSAQRQRAMTRIPKKSASVPLSEDSTELTTDSTAAERAQMALMGLPQSFG